MRMNDDEEEDEDDDDVDDDDNDDGEGEGDDGDDDGDDDDGDGDDDDEDVNAEDEVDDEMVEDDDVEKEEDDYVEEDNVEEEDDKDEHVAEDEVDDHDVAEDEVEDDEVEDDDVKGEKDDDLMLRRGKMIMLRMMRLRRKTDPKTGKHTLCEPEWSKSMSTCHKRHQKSHFRRKFTGKMRRPRFGPERRRRLCASLRSQNACADVTRDITISTLYGKLQAKCRGLGGAQNADTHFERACAVETHVKISQTPLYPEIYR